MKKIALILILALLFVSGIVAQQNPADVPASKEDVQHLLSIMNSRDMMLKMVNSMTKPMHQMIHEQYVRDKDKLPPDFEDRMNKMMDDEMKSFPWDQMSDAMVPVYQKHLTKHDVDLMVAFYSGPTGQKLLKEMPAIMGDAMQAMMPVMRKQMDGMTERMQEQIAEMTKNPAPKSGKATQPSPD
jgi:hypothetical protein